MSTFGPIQGLGTVWYFEFFDGVFDTKAAQAATRVMREFESSYSRFKSDSWLSILNQERQFNEPDQEFIDLLDRSLDYFIKTKGIFNIAIGEKMEASGYDVGYSLKGRTEDLPEAPDLSQVLSITPHKVLLTAGKLDLGGIGKGYLIDKLARLFKEDLGLEQFLINGGGDIFATHNNHEAIEIQLAHPFEQNKYIATVRLKNQGFAASSPYLRAWKDPVTGKEYNHIHTTNKVATYVLGENATEADVYATVLAIDPEATHPDTIRKMLIQETAIISRDPGFELVTR